MAVVTREDVQALRNDVPAVDEMTTKEAVVSEQGERIAKLEGAAEHWATKADVKDVLIEVGNVRTEVAGVAGRVDSVQQGIVFLKWVLGFLSIGVTCVLALGGWIVWLLLRLLAGGGVP